MAVTVLRCSDPTNPGAEGKKAAVISLAAQRPAGGGVWSDDGGSPAQEN